MDSVKIEVTHKINDGVSYFDIGFPKSQKQISIKYSSLILAAGISLLIKAGNKSGDIKDYELLGEVIDYLKSEFVSTKSFEDAKILPNTFKKNE